MAALLQDRPPRDPAPGKKWIQVPKVVAGQETYEWTEVDDVAGPQWPPRDQLRLLNHDIQRVDGPEKVNGRARYSHDMRFTGMLYGRLLLCPHPTARVELDLTAAKALDGVHDVRSLLDAQSGNQTRFVGQPVAAVAARTPEIAEDALHAIVARYEPLPFVIDHAQSVREGAPAVSARGPNVRDERGKGDESEALAALENAATVVDARYSVPVQHHVCLETHGLVVDYRGGDEADVYASTQSTFAVQDQVPGPLGLDKGKIVVHVPYMGGGFGSKFEIGVEGRVACELARDLKTPIHMLLTRAGEFLTAGNRSGAVAHVRAGLDADGRLAVMHSEIDRMGGVGRGAHAGLPYIYPAGTSFLRMRSVSTNTDANRAFRAPGHPQASFAMESVLDELAYAAGRDLLELRKLNLPPAERATYERQLDRAALEIGWEAHEHKTTWDKSDALEKTGIGFGISTWGGGGGPDCKVSVRIDREGGVSVLCGSQDLGTGTRTYMAAIVAEELGLPVSAVSARLGDSRLGNANGSGGSTTAASLAPSVKDAAFEARKALIQRLASELKVPASGLSLAAGGVLAPGGKRIAWREACALLGPDGLEAQGVWRSELAGLGVHGATAAKVAVDTLTGRVQVVKMVCVQDCGLPLNRLALRSQINGGMIQALSYGLFEERVIDPDLGFVLNANLGDYKIAGCQEMPELVAIIDDGDTRNQVIGMAEPAIIAGQSAIANAVQNACGVRVRDLPITADKVLMGLLGRDGAKGSKS